MPMNLAGLSEMQLCKVQRAFLEEHRPHSIPRGVVAVLKGGRAVKALEGLIQLRQSRSLVAKKGVRVHVRGIQLQRSLQSADGALVISRRRESIRRHDPGRALPRLR